MPPTRLPTIRDLTRLCITCRAHLRGPSSSSSSSSPSSTSRLAFFSQTTTTATHSESKPTPNNTITTPPSTHYDLFPETLPSGPPPSGHFPINTRALRLEFLRLQSLHHPDMHQHHPTSKALAEQHSALINTAYRTLSNPLLRAQYLLSLRGVDVANDETLKIEEPDLLHLVLDAHEAIEEAQSDEDLVEIKVENEERIRESEERLDGAFARDDVEGAKREAVRMRYWVNIKDALDNWEQGKPVVVTQH